MHDVSAAAVAAMDNEDIVDDDGFKATSNELKNKST